MVEFLVIVGFLLFWLAAVCVYGASVDAERSSVETVRTELLIADQRVTDEHRRARRAMNDAAGQSWRNLTG